MPIEDEFNPSADNPFVSGQDDFDRRLAERARVIVTPDTHVEVAQKQASNWSELSSKEKKKAVGIGVGATALVTASVLAGPTIAEQLDGPDFATETTTVVVEPGDTLWDIVESIPGHENAPTDVIIEHITSDPANIDILNSPDLQPGTSITVPVKIDQ